MKSGSTTKQETNKKKRAPARTLEARENQMIYLAVDLAEKQLADGTASAQVITHYLKLGTTRERLEKQKLEHENELLKARTQSLKAMEENKDLYENAIKAMRDYGGEGDGNDDSFDD